MEIILGAQQILNSWFKYKEIPQTFVTFSKFIIFVRGGHCRLLAPPATGRHSANAFAVLSLEVAFALNVHFSFMTQFTWLQEQMGQAHNI